MKYSWFIHSGKNIVRSANMNLCYFKWGFLLKTFNRKTLLSLQQYLLIWFHVDSLTDVLSTFCNVSKINVKACKIHVKSIRESMYNTCEITREIMKNTHEIYTWFQKDVEACKSPQFYVYTFIFDNNSLKLKLQENIARDSKWTSKF